MRLGPILALSALLSPLEPSRVCPPVAMGRLRREREPKRVGEGPAGLGLAQRGRLAYPLAAALERSEERRLCGRLDHLTTEEPCGEGAVR